MVQTKYTSIHLGNAFKSLTIFYQAQLGLALLLILGTVIRLIVG